MRHLKQMATGILLLLTVTTVGSAQELAVTGPEVFLKGVAGALTVSGSADGLITVRAASGETIGEAQASAGSPVSLDVIVTDPGQLPLTVELNGGTASFEAPLLPGLVSIIPPLVAIALALIFKEVVVSLVAGIWLGGLFLAGYNPISALVMVSGRFAREALADPDRAAIVVFSLLLGGMVGILSKMGATTAIVDALTPFATSRKRGLLATWFAGLAIFFDDYANTLVVGNTMRPITDRLKISREKLAYIVDSTAAPVTAIMFVSTWVGYEISLIGDGFGLAAAQNASDPAIVAALESTTPFATFIATIPYLFYPILAIAMVAILIFTGRDFGPMLQAEQRAASGGGVYRPGAMLSANLGDDLGTGDGKARWWHGVLPVLTLVVTVLWGLVITGKAAIPPGDPAGIRQIFSNADPFTPLLWGSLLACVVAIVISVTTRALGLKDSIEGMVDGMRSMMMAMIILVCAWSLADVTSALNTAGFLASALSDAIAINLIPVTVFVVSSAMAFATGTSWGTMAIMLPIVIPLMVTLGGADVVPGAEHVNLLYSSMAAVLSGAIFGDHCSPISDTTVLSSMASGCDHVDHVRTQLPYALTVAMVGIVLGNIGEAYGLNPILSLVLGVVVIWAIIMLIGKKDLAEA